LISAALWSRSAVTARGASEGGRSRQHEQPRIAQRVEAGVGAGRQRSPSRQPWQPGRFALAEHDRGDVERGDIGWRAGGTWKPTAGTLADVAVAARRATSVCVGSAAGRRDGRPDGIARNRRSTLRSIRAGSTSPATPA